jgi:molybdopterin-guanine dinucleotide biosynthesis protein A
MGTDKAWIPVNGRPLLLHQLALVQASGASEILISVRNQISHKLPTIENARIVEDRCTGIGPLGGIEACLHAASHDSLLVLAVDLPSLSIAYINALLAQSKPGGGAIAVHQDFFEPLASLYPKSALGIAQALIAEGQYTLQRFAAACIGQSLASKWVVPQEFEHCLTNWNNPTDWTEPPIPPHSVS